MCDESNPETKRVSTEELSSKLGLKGRIARFADTELADARADAKRLGLAERDAALVDGRASP